MTPEEEEFGEALVKLVDLLLEITQEQEPEYYAWLMRWNSALKEERFARESRKQIESEEPKRE